MAGTPTMTVALGRRASAPAEPPPIPHTAARFARGSDPAIAVPPDIAAGRRSRRRSKPATLSPNDRAGWWKVESELGKGGMATVYAVTHTRFGKRAALKLAHRSILGPKFTPDTFLREARVVNLVDHPGVPDVFATGTYDGRPYLAMERLHGQTLGARLEAGPMGWREAFEILLDLCDVVAAAHKAGVVHRDLKLDNVFLLDTPCAGGHRVKLLDWGVASILGEDDPLGEMIAGTLTYVAPEQIRGDGVSTAADIYSLAVLAYQVLLGQPPFASRSDLELIHKHLREEPPTPASLCSDIPADLDSLLLGMLSKTADDRPTIDEVIAVFTAANASIGPAPTAAKRAWLDLDVPALPPLDVLGRPALHIPALGNRVLGATIAIAAAIASLVSFW